MSDIVTSGDNLQEKSNLYFWEEYENCFTVFHPYFYTHHRAIVIIVPRLSKKSGGTLFLVFRGA